MSKFNPDIGSKFNINKSIRNCSVYEFKKDIYNPITNQIPNNIKNHKDLKLKMDTPCNLNKLMQNKINERNIKYDVKDKKVVKNNYGIQQNTFNNLKNIHNKLENKRRQKKESKDKVIQSLKDLGIFN